MLGLGPAAALPLHPQGPPLPPSPVPEQGSCSSPPGRNGGRREAAPSQPAWQRPPAAGGGMRVPHLGVISRRVATQRSGLRLLLTPRGLVLGLGAAEPVGDVVQSPGDCSGCVGGVMQRLAHFQCLFFCLLCRKEPLHQRIRSYQIGESFCGPRWWWGTFGQPQRAIVLPAQPVKVGRDRLR